MKQTFAFIFAFLIFIVNNYGSNDVLKEFIRQYIENISVNERYNIEKEKLFSSQVLPRFYENRGFNPAWIDNGKITPNGLALIKCIRNADEQGLNSSDYHLSLIESYGVKFLFGTNNRIGDQRNLEILLTDAFMMLASHIYFGKVDTDSAVADWNIQRDEPTLRIDSKLQEAIDSNNIVRAFEKLQPNIKKYEALKSSLAFFKSLKTEEWKTLSLVKSIKLGDTSSLLPIIRNQLKLLGYAPLDSESTTYDSAFGGIVALFQEENGFNNDSVIGRLFIKALNTSPAKRIDIIRVNMERTRWLPKDFPTRYINVNIANQRMDVIEDEDTMLTCRAIVGKTYRSTPIFSAKMTYLVFSPTWTVPPGILSADVIPQLKKGPEYLQKKQMKIIRFDGTEIPYDSINWKKMSSKNFPYMVRQIPGPHNSLGLVKFMFPNQYNVYIHDTPDRTLFAKDDRAQSSGCIRIEKPFELAQYLLSPNPKWNDSLIYDAMTLGIERTVSIPQAIPVFITYFTAWANKNGTIEFRRDIYERDEKVLKALNEKPTAFFKTK